MCSRKASLTLLWTILASSVTFASIQNTRSPNVLVFVGQPVTFPLIFSSCNWDRNLNGDLTPIYTSSDKTPTNSRYSINQTIPDQCDLTIKNVTFSDAGIYQYANGEQYGLELFVINQNPLCFVMPDNTQSLPNSSGGNITLGCSLSYSNKDRKLFPTLKWQPLLTINDKSMHSGDEKTVQNGDYSTITSLFSVPYGTRIEHVSCFAQMAGIPFSSSDSKIAQNAVIFSGHCEIGQIEIPAKNVKIISDENMRLGDKIVCSADGYPAVNYYWTKKDIRVGETPALILDTVGMHTYRCFAYNVIEGHKHTISIERTILINQDKEAKDNTARALSGMSLAGLLLVPLIIVLWMKFRRRCCNRPIGSTDVMYSAISLDNKFSDFGTYIHGLPHRRGFEGGDSIGTSEARPLSSHGGVPRGYVGLLPNMDPQEVILEGDAEVAASEEVTTEV